MTLVVAVRLPYFFVDLPNEEERKQIWEIVISRFGRDPKDFDLVQLSRITDGFTGSEIQSVFFDTMFTAYEHDDDPTDLYIAEVLNGFVPLSKTMAENIDSLRKWSKGRCRLATSTQQPERKLRKIAA